MIKHLIIALVVLAALFAGAVPTRADLAAYLAKPEPAYRWEKRGQTSVGGGTVSDLHLVSQTWQGIKWEHRIQIFRPDKIDYPGFCALLNTGGSGSDRETAQAMAIARASGTVFAVVYNIPNQPLFDGKTEDALIAHTWLKFLETGDESWPLNFPMAKSVIKGMDAIQAFTKEAGHPPISEFLITGASKRGWTAWLTGASRDPRIKAIAPMVIDMLNIPAQTPHQIASYGKPSEQVADYTRAGLLEKFSTKPGKRLVEMVDPYAYRDILTMPKLIILGTNDRYWSQDALNLYWPGLKGRKYVAYIPNSGHNLEDKLRALGTLTAFNRAVAGKKRWPEPTWSYKENENRVELTVRSDIAPVSARLFRTHAPTRDFRSAKWTSEPMNKRGDGFVGGLERPASGYTALFGEMTYTLDGKPFTLTTQINIVGAKP